MKWTLRAFLGAVLVCLGSAGLGFLAYLFTGKWVAGYGFAALALLVSAGLFVGGMVGDLIDIRKRKRMEAEQESPETF